MSLSLPRVDFYHDADNKLAVAARLAQKGVAAGMRLLLLAPDAEAAALADRTLWTFSAHSFVPHARADSALADQSPVVILLDGDSADAINLQKFSANATSGFDVLINLGERVPEPVSPFRRVIEIATRDEHDKASARERFKAYRAMGCELVAHRLGQTE